MNNPSIKILGKIILSDNLVRSNHKKHRRILKEGLGSLDNFKSKRNLFLP